MKFLSLDRLGREIEERSAGLGHSVDQRDSRNRPHTLGCGAILIAGNPVRSLSEMVECTTGDFARIHRVGEFIRPLRKHRLGSGGTCEDPEHVDAQRSELHPQPFGEGGVEGFGGGVGGLIAAAGEASHRRHEDHSAALSGAESLTEMMRQNRGAATAEIDQEEGIFYRVVEKRTGARIGARVVDEETDVEIRGRRANLIGRGRVGQVCLDCLRLDAVLGGKRIGESGEWFGAACDQRHVQPARRYFSRVGRTDSVGASCDHGPRAEAFSECITFVFGCH